MNLTAKRRENLVKFCVSAFTVDTAGLFVPLILRVHPFSAILFTSALLVGVVMIVAAYHLER